MTVTRSTPQRALLETLALRLVNPPIWLDERGQPRPKRPCPGCGREIPVLSVPTDLLKWYG
jgi:hypothetical protein